MARPFRLLSCLPLLLALHAGCFVSRLPAQDLFGHDPARRAPAATPVGTTPPPAFSALHPEATKPSVLAENAAKGRTDRLFASKGGPTEITAEESFFNANTHIATFVGNVYVLNGDLTIYCDKLTAYMKHGDLKNAPPRRPAPVAAASRTVGAVPRLMAPGHVAVVPPPESDQPEQASGLDHAVAEGNVEIIQDKAETDGKITRSIAHAKIANYDTTTGDVILRGKPDITQGINTTVALEEGVVMVLNGSGHLETKEGEVKVVISESRTIPRKSTPAPR